MFKSVRLKNFKCYEDAQVEMGRVTIIIGPNNAGKSAILHSLLLLGQSIETPTGEALVTAGREVDLGSGRDILHAGSEPAEFEIEVTLDKHAASPEGGDNLLVRFGVKDASTQLLSSTVSKKGDVLLGVTAKASGGWSAQGLSKKEASLVLPGFIAFLPNVMVKSSGDTPPAPSRLLSLGFHIYFEWRNIFQRVWHTRPLRIEIPQFAQTGKTFDSTPESGGEAFLVSLKERGSRPKNKSIIDKLNDWVKSHDFMVDELTLAPLDQEGRLLSLLAREKNCDQQVNVANMGRGISQALPIIARILRSVNGECGVIEQPELHLHPAAQAQFGDAVAEHVMANPKSQIIIETHSEHLLSRIRYHVAAGSLAPDDVRVICVERDKGKSTATMLPLDEYGNFVRWPKGFFQEGYNEALAIAKEGAKRRASTSEKPKRRK